MFKVICLKCQKKVESSLAQKYGHCELQPFCEACIDMQIHNCGGKTMDEEYTQDYVARLLAAIDDLQVARGSTEKAEEEAFETLLQIRNDMASAHYA